MNDNDIETFREIQASVSGVPRGYKCFKGSFFSLVAQKNQ